MSQVPKVTFSSSRELIPARFSAGKLTWLVTAVATGASCYALLKNKWAAEPRSDSGFDGRKADNTTLNNFKREVFGKYENRIREMSSPEKIFEYFASVKKENGESFMTPDDFIRSITPYNFASVDVGPGLGRGQSQVSSTTEIFQQIDQNGDGLISFSEFIFFTTLLSIPEKYFSVAFRMFDEDGSGEVDQEEFKRVMKFMRQQNPLAQAERKSRVSAFTEGGLYPIFFGEDGSKKLSLPEFTSFIDKLRNSILTIQFNTLKDDPESSSISARNFALNLITYGNPRNLSLYEKRIRELESSNIRISYKEFQDFQKTLRHLDEVDFAIRMFLTANEPFTKMDLKRAAHSVAGVDLTDNCLNVVFFLFDRDGDDRLDYDEFVGVLVGMATYGLSKPRDSGVTRLLNCVQSCWKSEVVERRSRV